MHTTFHRDRGQGLSTFGRILTIGDPKHSMGPFNRLANRCLITKVRLRSISSAPPDLWASHYLDDFNPLIGQGFGSRFGRVSGNTADLVLLGQGGMGKHALDNGTTLLAGGAKDCKNLTHGRVDCLPLWDFGVGKKRSLRMFWGKNESKTVDEGCRMRDVGLGRLLYIKSPSLFVLSNLAP